MMYFERGEFDVWLENSQAVDLKDSSPILLTQFSHPLMQTICTDQ